MSQPHYTEDESDTAITGVRVAIVRDNEDPEDIGRVKLEYPWRDADDESYWARIATDMTGEDYGTYYLPEVEDEVLVSFENGDIHKPIVIGSLWTGKQKPPEDNADGNNDIRTITTRKGHKIEFDDNKQDGAVRIETDAGHEVVLNDESGSESITITDKSDNSIEMDAVSNEISISAGKEISLEAPTISLSAENEAKVESSGQLKLSSNAKAELSSGQLNLDSDGNMGLNANGALTLNGAIISLN